MIKKILLFRWLAAFLLGITLCLHASAGKESVFFETPYLQLGYRRNATDQLEILWHAADEQSEWKLRYCPISKAMECSNAEVSYTILDRKPFRRRIYSAVIRNLAAGEPFLYGVLKEDRIVFQSTAQVPKGPDQPTRVAIFGDSGAGNTSQKKIASRVYQAKPDLVIIPGDIVYSSGRLSEYHQHFFAPYANAETPLLSSTLFVSSLGNHDLRVSRSNPQEVVPFRDSLGYFFYWRQPLNGTSAVTFPAQDPNLLSSINLAAPGAYPTMANFSFDYGDAHWTVLDSNPFEDWTKADLRAWLRADLDRAQEKKWRFVVFHHAPFHSAKTHQTHQWMRSLADLFQDEKVDIVFSGHVHDYQRTYPLLFQLTRPGDPPGEKSGLTPGEFVLDKSFDGRNNTHPKGVIYVVTGAGGDRLTGAGQQSSSWQPFTASFQSRQHSFTQLNIQGPRLTLEQIDTEGRILDSISIEKQ